MDEAGNKIDKYPCSVDDIITEVKETMTNRSDLILTYSGYSQMKSTVDKSHTEE